MPFTTLDRRVAARNGSLKEWQPGDYCFMEYCPLAYKWGCSPRWTTADQLFGYVLLQALLYTVTFRFAKLKALLLAWQVFFIKKVMPYEDIKENENGTI